MRAACSSCIQGRTEVVCYSKADKSIRRSLLGLPWVRSAKLVRFTCDFAVCRSGSQHVNLFNLHCFPTESDASHVQCFATAWDASRCMTAHQDASHACKFVQFARHITCAVLCHSLGRITAHHGASRRITMHHDACYRPDDFFPYYQGLPSYVDRRCPFLCLNACAM